MKYEVVFTNQFKKDYKLAKKQGKNIALLKNVIQQLADGEELPPKYRDHLLAGNYAGYRECHILPDWLLVYKKQDEIMVLFLFRIGSHSDLF